MIENEKDLVCSKKHDQPIQQVSMNHQIPVSQRLLCASCISDSEEKFTSISIKQAKNIIFQKQEKLQEMRNQSTKKTLEQLNTFKQQVDTLKSNIIRQFDSLIKNAEEWANSLIEFNKQKCQYSLIEEIEYIDESTKYQEEKQMYEFNQFNYSYYKKIETMFQIDGLFKSLMQTKQAIDDLNTGNITQIQYPQQFIRIKKLFKNSTPFIALDCQKHKSEIIFVDIRKNINKEERLKCIDCRKEHSITVMEFSQLWDKYMDERQQKVKDIQCEQNRRLNKIMGYFYQFVDLAKKTRENSYDIISTIQTKAPQEKLITMALKLCQIQLKTTESIELDEENQIYEISNNKLDKLTQQLNQAFETYQFKLVEQINDQSNIIQTSNSLVSSQTKISYQIISGSIKQQEWCYAIVFNHDGSIMAATCGKDIKLWLFENGKMLNNVSVILQGHTDEVYCQVYSKNRNWIASGGNDCTLRLWKDMGNNLWKSSEPGKNHINFIYCLLMNKNEDLLISGSNDKSIKIWKIDFNTNQINFDYSLDQHQQIIDSISLNESETTLVSSSRDKQIIIWGKGENQKFQFKYTINKSVDDMGKRICFTNEQTIVWQQCSKGFMHIFKIENGKFIEKSDEKIELKQNGDEDYFLFPTVFNKQKQLLIQRHNRYVYIMRLQQNGKFKIECEPIDCVSNDNYGSLTNDGQYLVIWNKESKEFKVYKLIYE